MWEASSSVLPPRTSEETGNASESAFERMMELLDLTIGDPRWRNAGRLRELVRLREEVCDVFHANDTYGTPIEDLKRYFLYFGIAARMGR